MKTLVIYAHPKTPGHNPEILREVKNKLEKKKVQFEVLDLYEMKYDPVLHEEEHYTSGNKEISKKNKETQEKIKEASRLIFIYPLWWNSMPAVLKGFFDRILTPGFAYHFTKNGFPVGHLKGKKASLFITRGGPSAYYDMVLRNRGAKVVQKDTLGFCGIKARVFSISNCSKPLDGKKKTIIKKTVRRGLGWLLR